MLRRIAEKKYAPPAGDGTWNCMVANGGDRLNSPAHENVQALPEKDGYLSLRFYQFSC
jgi:hypothetical protein